MPIHQNQNVLQECTSFSWTSDEVQAGIHQKLAWFPASSPRVPGSMAPKQLDVRKSKSSQVSFHKAQKHRGSPRCQAPYCKFESQDGAPRASFAVLGQYSNTREAQNFKMPPTFTPHWKKRHPWDSKLILSILQETPEVSQPLSTSDSAPVLLPQQSLVFTHPF